MLKPPVSSGIRLFCAAFCLLSICFWVSQYPVLAAEPSVSPPVDPLVPKREITQESGTVPEWKMRWDKARQYARTGDYGNAVQEYEKLLIEKHGLEEAQWELAKIYIKLGELDKSAAVLELLLESAPEKLEYLESLASIMSSKGHIDRAVDLHKQVLLKEPENTTALYGVVKGLFELGRKKDSLPFLERLHRNKPDDARVREDLASLYYDLERYPEARPLLVDIAQDKDAPLSILLMTAKVHNSLGLDNLAMIYWQRVLAIDPQNYEANEQLANYYDRAGQGDKALEHFLILLAATPDNPELLKRVGMLQMSMGRYDQALQYFERYNGQRPDDKEVLRKIVDVHSAMGNTLESLEILERYFSLESQPDLKNLKQAADLYEASGRHDDAIVIYKRILAITPDDSLISARLAKDFLIVGKEAEAEAIWRNLARNEKLLEVLETLHSQEPSDERIALKLANMYLEKGVLEKSKEVFDELVRRGHMSADLLASRGALYEQLAMPAHALTDYERLLEQRVNLNEIRLRCIKLAGKLGRLTEVRHHLALLDKGYTAENDITVRLAVAGAYSECGLHEQAVQEYQDLLSDVSGQKELKLDVLLKLSQTYKSAGLPYECEQTLRIALTVDPQSRMVLSELYDLTLASIRLDEAKVWLDRLADLYPSPNEWEIGLMRAKHLAADGEYRYAVKLGRRLLEEMPEAEPLSMHTANGSQSTNFEVRLFLARFLLAAEKYHEAESQCLQLIDDWPAELEPRVILLQVYYSSKEYDKAEEIFSQTLTIARKDPGLLLRLSLLYRQYNRTSEMVRLAELANNAMSDSLKAKLLLAEACELDGRNSRAVALLEQVAAEYPENGSAATMLARYLFKTGQYDEALSKCESLLSNNPQRADMLLLKARILWAKNKWAESQKIYKVFLQPSVDELLAERASKLGLSLPAPRKPSIWEIITFKKDYRKGLAFADTLMTPTHAVDNDDGEPELHKLAASLYAQYRWQQKFSMEIDARRSVQRGEFLQAVKDYEALINEYPHEESLIFDLAGIYSRLGRLGAEADLYEKLSELNADLPGLSKAIMRNRLKREPRVSAAYGFQQREGHDGYIDIRKDWASMNFYFSPQLHHEIDFSATRNFYKRADREKDVESSRAIIGYKSTVIDRLSFSVGGGIEAVDKGSNDTVLVNCDLSGDITDRLSSHLSFVRDVKDDTTASLTRNIVQHKIRAGVDLDLFPRLIVGGNYEYIDYSDDNATEGYDVWSSYVLFKDPTFLKFSYTFDFKDSEEGAMPGIALEDGFASDDHPYWSPKNYWINSFSLFFKHQLSEDLLGRGAPRYYTAEYTLEYDSAGHAIQTIEGGFFIEWNPSFIVEATAAITSSDIYRSREIFLSAIYRW